MDHARKQKIIQYYETCEGNYRNWWDLDRSLAMHAGFWDAKTKTLHEALINENKILASIAHIKAGDYVLDAGCGVGGSSIYLAGASSMFRDRHYTERKASPYSHP